MCQAFTYMTTYISPNPACYASGDMLLKRAQHTLSMADRRDVDPAISTSFRPSGGKFFAKYIHM